jgi:hypothetical protein
MSVLQAAHHMQILNAHAAHVQLIFCCSRLSASCQRSRHADGI